MWKHDPSLRKRPEGMEAFRGFAIMGRKEDQRVEPGIRVNIFIGLFGEPSAGKICGQLLAEKLSLIIATISGEEKMDGIGTEKNGGMTIGVAGGMYQEEVIVAGEGAGVLEGREGFGEGVCALGGGQRLIGIEKNRLKSFGKEGAVPVFPFQPVDQDGRIGESSQAARVIEMQMGEDDGGWVGKVQRGELSIYLLIGSDVEPELRGVEPMSQRTCRAE